jgi:prepilin-type N-terminal cleavage/methylation domain-containing protein
MRHCLARARSMRGFTLTELAIVATIVALLLASLMYTLSAQVDQRNMDDTRRRLEQARELVLAYALANGRLPCPSRYTSGGTNSSGLESFCTAATGTCSGTETTTVQSHGNCSNYYDGYLPAATIGFQPVDSNNFAVDIWGNRIRYVVTKTAPACAPANTLVYTSAANLKTYGLTCQPPDLLICKAASTGGTPITAASCITAANQAFGTGLVPAIIFSTGKNFNSAQTATAATTLGRTDEAANLDGDASFVYHPLAGSEAASGGEFDDQFVWITTGEFYGRLVSAGVLP